MSAQLQAVRFPFSGQRAGYSEWEVSTSVRYSSTSVQQVTNDCRVESSSNSGNELK